MRGKIRYLAVLLLAVAAAPGLGETVQAKEYIDWEYGVTYIQVGKAYKMSDIVKQVAKREDYLDIAKALKSKKITWKSKDKTVKLKKRKLTVKKEGFVTIKGTLGSNRFSIPVYAAKIKCEQTKEKVNMIRIRRFGRSVAIEDPVVIQAIRQKLSEADYRIDPTIYCSKVSGLGREDFEEEVYVEMWYIDAWETHRRVAFSLNQKELCNYNLKYIAKNPGDTVNYICRVYEQCRQNGEGDKYENKTPDYSR